MYNFTVMESLCTYQCLAPLPPVRGGWGCSGEQEIKFPYLGTTDKIKIKDHLLMHGNESIWHLVQMTGQIP